MVRINGKHIMYRWCASFFMSAALLAVTWHFCNMMFETNDDWGIMGYIAGFRTGTPEAATIFSNILWGGILSALYKLFGGISWYAIAYAIIIWMTIALVLYKFIPMFLNVRERIIGILFFAFLFFCVFFFHATIVQFTDISAFLGMDALLVGFYWDDGDCNNNFNDEVSLAYKRIVGSAVLFFFSCIIRPKVGQMVLACIFLTWGFKRFLLKSKRYDRLLFLFFSIFVFVWGVNAAYEHFSEGWEEFREYHVERAGWTDYGRLPYLDENKQIYANVGWDENLFNLAQYWYFMDENINQDSFSYLNDEMEKRQEGKWMERLLYVQKSIFTPDSDLERWSHVQKVFLVTALVFAILILTAGKDKRLLLYQVGIFMLAFLAVALYLTWKGRLPFRVSDAMILIFLAPVWIHIICHGIVYEGIEGGKAVSMTIISVILVASIGYALIAENGFCHAAIHTYDNDISRTYYKMAAELNEYALQHHENVYIYETGIAAGEKPFKTFPNKKPYNLLFWGGSGMYSPLYYKQLEKNGLSSLLPEDFYLENVFFITLGTPNEWLLDRMMERFPGTEVEMVETMEYFSVYRFTK